MVGAKHIVLGVVVFVGSASVVLGILFGLFNALTSTRGQPVSSALLHTTRSGFDPCIEVRSEKTICFTLVILSHASNEGLRDSLATVYANETVKRDFCFEPIIVIFNGNTNNIITNRIEHEFGQPTVVFEEVSAGFLALLRKRDHPYVFVLDSFVPHPRRLRQVVNDQSQTWNCTLRYCSVFERLFSLTACGSNCTSSLSPALAGCIVSSTVFDKKAEYFANWSFSQEIQMSLFTSLPEGSSVYEFHKNQANTITVRRMVRHHLFYYRPGSGTG